MRRALGIALALLASLVAPTAAPAERPAAGTPETVLQRDGSAPLLDADDGAADGVFTVGEQLGERPGDGPNLFHRFERFDVAAGDTALFTADSGLPTDWIVTRVCCDASEIDGALRSDVAGASLLFLNPHGIAFGPEASVDVQGAFFASTADRLHFADATVLEAGAAGDAVLTLAPPDAFGFLGDDPAGLAVEGFVESAPGHDVALVGGGLTIDGSAGGGVVSAPDGDVHLVSVGSALPGDEGLVAGPFEGSAPVLTGFAARGDVTIRSDAIVSSSGISPLDAPLEAPDGTPRVLNEAGLGGVEQEITLDFDAPAADFVPEGGVLVDDQVVTPQVGEPFRLVRYFVSRFENPAFRELAERGAGDVLVRARDLRIEDADVRAVAPSGEWESAGAPAVVDVELTGELAIVRALRVEDVGILARGGLELPATRSDGGARVPTAAVVAVPYVATGERTLVELDGFALDLTRGPEPGGTLRLAAQALRAEGGAIASATTLTAGPAGRIDVDVEGRVLLTGADRDRGRASGFFTNNEGSATTGGRIEIDAQRLELSDSSGIFAQTTRDGRAGDVVVEVAELLVEGGSQIDSSTSGQGVAPGELASGAGGNLRIHARERIVLSGRDDAGRSRLSTFSKAASTGDGGVIAVSTPLLEVRDGAGIEATTSGAGAGGDVLLDVASLRVSGGLVAADSRATASAGVAGDIVIGPDALLGARAPRYPNRSVELVEGAAIRTDTRAASGGNVGLNPGPAAGRGDRLVVRDSEITTSVLRGVGDGGNVTLAQRVVVLSDGRVVARADAGQGGAIAIRSDAFLQAGDSVVDASAGPAGIDGTVELASPALDLVAPLAALPESFLDAEGGLGPRCATRRDGEPAGRFSVAPVRLGPSPDVYLTAPERGASRPGTPPCGAPLP